MPMLLFNAVGNNLSGFFSPRLPNNACRRGKKIKIDKKKSACLTMAHHSGVSSCQSSVLKDEGLWDDPGVAAKLADIF